VRSVHKASPGRLFVDKGGVLVFCITDFATAGRCQPVVRRPVACENKMPTARDYVLVVEKNRDEAARIAKDTAES
jgi:hypothetical protein